LLSPIFACNMLTNYEIDPDTIQKNKCIEKNYANNMILISIIMMFNIRVFPSSNSNIFFELLVKEGNMDRYYIRTIYNGYGRRYKIKPIGYNDSINDFDTFSQSFQKYRMSNEKLKQICKNKLSLLHRRNYTSRGSTRKIWGIEKNPSLEYFTKKRDNFKSIKMNNIFNNEVIKKDKEKACKPHTLVETNFTSYFCSYLDFNE
ncbi:hypothetical protein A3Q56_03140, partial [Intoshia linei]